MPSRLSADDRAAPAPPDTLTGVTRHPVKVWPQSDKQEDWIAEEVPVALVYNGVSHAVMMASPTDLIQFALGFSFTEGIISAKADVYDCELQQTAAGIEIHLSISQRCFAALKNRHRKLSGKSGCGLCGVESLQMVARDLSPISADLTVSHQDIQHAVQTLEAQQVLQKLTGAVHAAAWCAPDGQIKHIAEDIGRHNALDKLIGILLGQETHERGFILISSRISLEMVQKVVAIGAPLVVGVSAPTSMALSEAEKYRLCVVGFSRPGRHVVYTQAQRVQEQP